MKKQILSLALIMATVGTAHAGGYVPGGTATATATVIGDTTWSIAEKTKGNFKTDGTVLENLTMTVQNSTPAGANAGQKFILAAGEKNKGNSGEFMMTSSDGTQFEIVPIDSNVITFDSSHMNYKSVNALAAGTTAVIDFKPKDGATLKADKYTMDMMLSYFVK